MKVVLLALLIVVASGGSAYADERGDGGWIGGLVGKQTDQSLKPTSFGASGGSKKGSIGFEGDILTGSVAVGGITESIFQLFTRLDIFLGGKFFYFGPELGYAKLTASATVDGITVAASASSLVYGAGGGINIPLGKVSLGADLSYLKGTAAGSDSIVSYVGSLKIWF